MSFHRNKYGSGGQYMVSLIPAVQELHVGSSRWTDSQVTSA